MFLLGVLWKRATPTAAFLTLTGGSALSLTLGLLQLNNWPRAGYWPHYMLLSFYCFAGLMAFMVVASLLTRPRPDLQLPTLAETYRQTSHSRSRLVWLLWGLMAVVMGAVYWVFN